MLIYIEGNIGSGKSTFVDMLNAYLHRITLKDNEFPSRCLVQEPVDEWMKTYDSDGQNILEKFYSNQKRWAFTFQMNSFISRAHRIQTERDEMVQTIYETDNRLTNTQERKRNSVMLVERSIYTDRHCFAVNCYESGNMTKMEYDIYCNWNNWLSDSFKLRPDAYIYLRCEPEINVERISKRSRNGESGIPEEYLRILHEKHDSWMENEKSKNIPVLTLDVSEDFTSDSKMEAHVENVCEFIKQL